MARDTPAADDAQTPQHHSTLPHLVTIVGRGVPSSFEIAVDGDLEMVDDEPTESATVVSGSVAEGSIDTGVRRFRFSGEMANVRVVDWNGESAPDSTSVPTVHIDYGVTN
ncbi:hypothetical protein [Natronosalvus caseinilyticus]|uniref:hypothetical protein n=1 Tax=Natronosalvus caseinilyticus TaxID=2953747 RepID=UPI0028A973F5|nr:hypothetical protein [Natronosalvus caseinilyticus]